MERKNCEKRTTGKQIATPTPFAKKKKLIKILIKRRIKMKLFPTFLCVFESPGKGYFSIFSVYINRNSLKRVISSYDVIFFFEKEK